MYTDDYAQAIPPEFIDRVVELAASFMRADPHLASRHCASTAVKQTFCECIAHQGGQYDSNPPSLRDALILEVLRRLELIPQPVDSTRKI